MDYHQMRRMEKSHICAQCQGELVTIWDGATNQHRLVCGQDRSHQGYQARLNMHSMLCRGKLDQEIGPGAQKMAEEMAARNPNRQALTPSYDLATKEPIARDKFLALEKWANSLGLKLYLGHVCLYHDKPYITIDGYYYLANKQGKNYQIGTRPLDSEERIKHQIPEGAYAYLAEVWLEGVKLPPTGLGIVTKEEIESRSERHPHEFRAPVVHDHPQRMAEKRAEWQLLRKLIPLEEEK